MAGSKPQTNREKALLAMKTPPPDGYYEWDGKDEDDRPLSKEEMQEGIKQARKKMGRPVGSRKTATTIRLDDEILEAFKATGPGWQTRLNDAVKDWLKTHSPA